MPATCTTNWSGFPPRTREVQFDEKWSFVFKKQGHCDPDDPADDRKGDTWDHVAIDAENRLVISVVPGERPQRQEPVTRTADGRRHGIALVGDGSPEAVVSVEGMPAGDSLFS